jgi:hypothetical protein
VICHVTARLARCLPAGGSTGTSSGRLEEAAPGHVDLVRRLFFDGLPEGLAGPLSEALESVYANIIRQGSLPPPVDWRPADG